jgi:hypothetical protein
MTKARTLADNFAADINGITAGTGITGGGTSGTVTVTNSMATEIDAKGDLVVGTGADTFSRLAVASTAGYLLSVDSGETTGLKWAAPAAGGKVLQVVQSSTTTSTTIASTSYQDTNLTATITPTSATSTILVMVSQFGYQSRNSTSINSSLQIVRGASSIYNADFAARLTATGATAVFLGVYTNLIYRDSPATTSATTYKTQGKVSSTADSGQIIYQDNSAPSTITLLEIGA